MVYNLRMRIIIFNNLSCISLLLLLLLQILRIHFHILYISSTWITLHLSGATSSYSTSNWRPQPAFAAQTFDENHLIAETSINLRSAFNSWNSFSVHSTLQCGSLWHFGFVGLPSMIFHISLVRTLSVPPPRSLSPSLSFSLALSLAKFK